MVWTNQMGDALNTGEWQRNVPGSTTVRLLDIWGSILAIRRSSVVDWYMSQALPIWFQVVSEWKAKVEDLGSELDASQKEARNYQSELFRLKAAWDEATEQLDTVKRENKNLADEIKDLLDQLSDGGETAKQIVNYEIGIHVWPDWEAKIFPLWMRYTTNDRLDFLFWRSHNSLPGRSIHELDKQRRRLEVEKEELQAALEEAEAALEQEENKVLRSQLELGQVREVWPRIALKDQSGIETHYQFYVSN